MNTYSYKLNGASSLTRALRVARRIYPNAYWYVTNERSAWEIVCGGIKEISDPSPWYRK